MEYQVVYTIEVEAETNEEAAARVMEILQDPYNQAWNFEVREEHGKEGILINMEEEGYCKECDLSMEVKPDEGYWICPLGHIKKFKNHE